MSSLIAPVRRAETAPKTTEGSSWQDVSHEDVFVLKYELLRRWALCLVGNDRADADDLVHAAFLRFVRQRPLLRAITNLDGYLYSLLRHLRFSQMRAASRRRCELLDILKHGSIVEGLLEYPSASTLEAKETLAAICRYACTRKQTSKAGSILLLRFFHGYYPSEIALIARMPYGAIRVWVSTARREARLFLHDAESDCIEPSRGPGVRPVESSDDIVKALRLHVGRTRSGPCLSSDEWCALYDDAAGSLTRERLAHLSSCESCLKAVTRYLGLDSYDDRYPPDMLGPDQPLHGGGTRQSRAATAADCASRVQRARPRSKRRTALHRRAIDVWLAWWHGAIGAIAPGASTFARLAGATCAIIAAIMLWRVSPWQMTAVSAATVLRDVRAAESSSALSPDIAVHRVFTLEERRVPDQRVLRRRRIEIWQSGTHGLIVRRAYDEKNALVAGEWTARDGTRMVYDREAGPRSESAATSMPLTPETIWRWEPSAVHYEQLVTDVHRTTLEERGGTYVLRFQASKVPGATGILDVSLTVSKTERRAVGQRLVVRHAHALREYLFSETTFERLGHEHAPAGAFEPDTELLGRKLSLSPERPSPPVAAATRTVKDPDPALDLVELDIEFTLHRLESCLGARPRLIRRASRIKVDAAFANAACADRATTAFSALPDGVSELKLRVPPLASGDSGDSGVFAEPIELPPARTVASLGAPVADPEDLDIALPHEARFVAERLALAQAHALAMQQIARTWPYSRVQPLDLQRQLMWQAMIREHAERVRQELATVIGFIESKPAPAVSADTERGNVRDLVITDAGEVAPAIDRLVALLEQARQQIPINANAEGSTTVLERVSRGEEMARAFLAPWALGAAGPTESR
jgi:DNA-directed RNA polymerase specialized sigma24 family protein